MDDCGIADTNSPAVRVLWERHGRAVHLILVPAAQQCTCGEPLGDDEDDDRARRYWRHSRCCPKAA